MDISRCHMKFSIANGYRSFRLQSCFNTSLFSQGVNCSTWLKEQIIFTQNVCLVYVQTRMCNFTALVCIKMTSFLANTQLNFFP